MPTDIKAIADLSLSNDFQKLFENMAKYYNPVQTNKFDKTANDKNISRTVGVFSGTSGSNFSKVVDTKTLKSANIYLSVSALGASTPSLKIKIYDYLKGEKFYLAEFEEFTSISSTQNRRVELSNLGKFLFFEITISDSATFKLDLVGKII